MQTSLIILHFVLEGLPTTGCPAQMVHQFLSGFFRDDGSLYFKEIIFNLKDDDAVGCHADDMDLLAESLAR
jgi:hypothetical protein